MKIEKNGGRALMRLGLPALGVVAACTAAEGPDYQGTAQSSGAGATSGETGGAGASGGLGGQGGEGTTATGGRGGAGGDGGAKTSAGGSDRGAVTIGVGGTGGDDDDDDDDDSSS